MSDSSNNHLSKKFKPSNSNLSFLEYYKNYFPAKLITKWLGGEEELARREICFTLENEIFIRYLSFQNSEAFAKELQRKLVIFYSYLEQFISC